MGHGDRRLLQDLGRFGRLVGHGPTARERVERALEGSTLRLLLAVGVLEPAPAVAQVSRRVA
jgi:hypothetical protein